MTVIKLHSTLMELLLMTWHHTGPRASIHKSKYQKIAKLKFVKNYIVLKWISTLTWFDRIFFSSHSIFDRFHFPSLTLSKHGASTKFLLELHDMKWPIRPPPLPPYQYIVDCKIIKAQFYPQFSALNFSQHVFCS